MTMKCNVLCKGLGYVYRYNHNRGHDPVGWLAIYIACVGVFIRCLYKIFPARLKFISLQNQWVDCLVGGFGVEFMAFWLKRVCVG